MSRADRVTRSAELQAVRQHGTRIRVSDLDVRALATSRGVPRVGVVVPKYKHSAVDRNRLKRRLRELLRLRLLPVLRTRGLADGAACPDGASALGASLDVVVRALPGAYQATRVQLSAEIEDVVRRVQGGRVP